MYILYRRVFASVQHTFLTCVVYTSLISRNVQRYSLIKIVIQIYLLITRFIYRYINQTLKRFCFVLFAYSLRIESQAKQALNMFKSHHGLCCKQRKPNKVNLFCCFLFDLYIRSIEFVYTCQ